MPDRRQVGLWTMDIVRSPEVDRSRGLVWARDRSTRSLLVPHWLAEYGTAGLLLVGGAGLVLGWSTGAWSWSVPLGLGALAYTSLNSLGWVLADRTRFAYAVPMLIALIGASSPSSPSSPVPAHRTRRRREVPARSGRDRA